MAGEIKKLKTAEFMIAYNELKKNSVLKITGYQNKFFDRLEFTKETDTSGGLKINTMFTGSPGTFFRAKPLRVWTPDSDDAFRGYYFMTGTPPDGGEGDDHDKYYELGDGHTLNPDFRSCTWTKLLDLNLNPYTGNTIYSISYYKGPDPQDSSVTIARWELKAGSTIISSYDISSYAIPYDQNPANATVLAAINKYNPFRPISGNYTPINNTTKKYFPLISWSMATPPPLVGFKVVIKLKTTESYGFTPYYILNNQNVVNQPNNKITIDWGDGYSEQLKAGDTYGKLINHQYNFSSGGDQYGYKEFVVTVAPTKGEPAQLNWIVFGYNVQLLEPWNNSTYWLVGNYRGTYSGGSTYSINDIVSVGTGDEIEYYRPKKDNPSGAPVSGGNANWEELIMYYYDDWGTNPYRVPEDFPDENYLPYTHTCVLMDDGGNDKYWIINKTTNPFPDEWLSYSGRVKASNFEWDAFPDMNNISMIFNNCTDFSTESYGSYQFNTTLTTFKNSIVYADHAFNNCSGPNSTFASMTGLSSGLTWGEGMFKKCTSGTFVKITEVPAATTNSHAMFEGDTSAVFTLLSNSGTGVQDGARMFYGCNTTTFPNLTSIGNSVTDGHWMFRECTKAVFKTTFSLPAALINGNYMFYQCGDTATNASNVLVVSTLPANLAYADSMFEWFGGTIFLGDETTEGATVNDGLKSQ